MSQVDDGQAQSVIGGKADAAATGAGGVTAIPLQPDTDAAAFTVVSGTAKQVSATRNAMLYINITTAASFKIEMGATSAVAATINAAQSNALGLVSLRVPRGWYVKITGTVTNYAITSVLE